MSIRAFSRLVSVEIRAALAVQECVVAVTFELQGTSRYLLSNRLSDNSVKLNRSANLQGTPNFFASLQSPIAAKQDGMSSRILLVLPARATQFKL